MAYVRLKPFNGRNHVKKTHTAFGIKFQEEKGWYKVDDDVADYLRGSKQIDHGPDSDYSADAFDVVDTLEEAQEMEEREKAKAERRTAAQAEKKTRIMSTEAKRTTQMRVDTNLPQTRTHKPSPMKQSSSTVEVPKWAHANAVASEETFDDQDGEFTDDMAAAVKPKKKSALQRIDGKAKNLNPDKPIKENQHDPDHPMEEQEGLSDEEQADEHGDGSDEDAPEGTPKKKKKKTVAPPAEG